MYAVNISITFTYTILPEASPPADLDLIFTDPSGVAIFYSQGTAYGAVYTPPTVDTNGSYVFTRSFASPGNWRIGVADGVDSTNYKLFHETKIKIQQSETIDNATFSV